jgi:transcriptional regulator with XRE-family HTH domain
MRRRSFVTGLELREARSRRQWTQEKAAEKLGVTQAYLSMLESGRRSAPATLARRAAELLDASATTLPLPEVRLVETYGSERLSAELASLGYPGFAHVRAKARRNPAEVLARALNERNLDTRVVEGLPWLVLTYAGLDWDWLVPKTKVNDRQNRLGFVTTLAAKLAAKSHDAPRERKLKEYVEVLDRSRLVKEDTLCHDSLTVAERNWLRANRSTEAKHWNLLTDMKSENLIHV